MLCRRTDRLVVTDVRLGRWGWYRTSHRKGLWLMPAIVPMANALASQACNRFQHTPKSKEANTNGDSLLLQD